MYLLRSVNIYVFRLPKTGTKYFRHFLNIVLKEGC